MTDGSLPGPVDFVLIEFPTGASTVPAVRALSDLLDVGTVRLYDIALIRRTGNGHTESLDIASPSDSTSHGFEALAGARSGLFDDEDIAQAGEALEPETTGLLLAYENAWATPFVTAAHRAGGQLVASQRIPAQALVDALEAAESTT